MNKQFLKKHLRYLVPELKLALIKEPGRKPLAVYSPEDMGKFVEPLRLYAEEHFIAYHLDAKSQVIGFQEISHGTISTSLVHPREVFKAAILSNSHALIVAHNHPAGSISPSPEDLSVWEMMKQNNLTGYLHLEMSLDRFKAGFTVKRNPFLCTTVAFIMIACHECLLTIEPW